MTQLTEKRTTASLHLLDLILSCGKAEVGVISVLAEALPNVLPPDCPTALPSQYPAKIWEEIAADEAKETSEPTLPAPASAVPAPAKKVAAKKVAAPAPVTEPAPAPAQPAPPAAPPAALPEESHELPEPDITPEAAERLRTLIRDTFTARSKKIAAEGDPNNEKKQAYTAAFTAAVKSFGADTVTLTDNSRLQAMLDAVRAL